MSEFEMAVADLPPGQAREVAVGGKPLAVFNVGGIFSAISNTCLHRGGPLGQGFLEGQSVTCPWHSWTFDVTTGENIVNAELKIACFPTRVEDGHVLVKVQ